LRPIWPTALSKQFDASPQLRSAHEAETEDIIAIFTALDNLDVLKTYQFVAANFDRLPKYGPEELNICSIADRQSRLDYDIQALAHSVEDARISASIGDQLEGYTATLRDHIDKLSAACNKVLAVAATALPSPAAVDINSSRRSRPQPQILSATGSSPTESAAAPAVKSGTRCNVIISGVAENRNPAEWSKKPLQMLLVLQPAERSRSTMPSDLASTLPTSHRVPYWSKCMYHGTSG
jgi:uncharacterized protein YdbL (DUF1318 family)